MAKKVLVISPIFSHPLTSGNRARIYQLLLNLQQLNHEVHFLYVNTENFNPELAQQYWNNLYVVPYKPPHNSLLKKVVRKINHLLRRESAFLYSIDDWYDPSLDAFLVQLSSQIQFDILIVEYVFFSKALECFGSDVLKLIDTHDVFSDRHKMMLKDDKFPHWTTTWFSTTAEEEAKGLSRADIVIAIQQTEKEFFSKLVDKIVVVIGHTVPLHQPVRRPASSKTMLFLGSENPMNVHGIQVFIKDIFPQIKSRFPDSKLILAGTICDAIESSESLTKLGKLEDLKATYDLADVVVNPIFFGTGLKIKTIEALGYAKPLVTTSIGAAGLEEGINQAFLVGDHPKEFTQAIVALLSDPNLSDRMASNAYNFAKQWNEESLKELGNTLS